MKKVFLCVLCLALSSCVNSGLDKKKAEDKYVIDYECNGLVCSFELVKQKVAKQYNLLGEEHDRILSTTKLSSEDSVKQVEWNISSAGSYASSTVAEENAFLPCDGDSCTDASNPTIYNFNQGEAIDVSVKGKGDSGDKIANISLNLNIPPIELKSQATLNIDPLGFSGQGTESASGISYSFSGSQVTFTCPSGYYIPNNAVFITNGGVTMKNPALASGSQGKLITITMFSPAVGGSISPGTWIMTNDTVPDSNGILQMSCVPEVGIGGYKRVS